MKLKRKDSCTIAPGTIGGTVPGGDGRRPIGIIGLVHGDIEGFGMEAKARGK